ncbi:hypothetical protein CDL15_Pgr018093 [Punica granatum]|uniref:Uncharacterized protein n=1 Tax=Punica granatum TaxID=22663 RepID=A0A218WI79_PUNGR|nr:hypothetical protein CDL15_Pgr018093 [Punica granatum]PKI64353.1 hypothetical protein CRG98_015213 [Punica granatum]
MLDKILRNRKTTARSTQHDPPRPIPQPKQEDKLAALKIVHAGGTVECYFMAIPAKKIMDKYPSCYVTRPDVFRRPWNSVVWPDEILSLGEKFFVVPRHTVRKLCQRIRKPGPNDVYLADCSSIMRSIKIVADESRDGMSSMSGSSIIMSRRKNGSRKQVRFMGVEEKLKKGPSKNVEKKVNNFVEEQKSKGLKVVQLNGENRKVRRSGIWQPSLAAIKERHGSNE